MKRTRTLTITLLAALGLDDSLISLLNRDLISPDEAYSRAFEKKTFEPYLSSQDWL